MKKILLIAAIQFSVSAYAQDGVSIEKITPTINTKIVFSEMNISKDIQNGKVSCRVMFVVLDSANNKIDNLIYSKSDEDFNTFWAGFTTGKFLYQQLELKNSSGNLITIPNSVEADFINK